MIPFSRPWYDKVESQLSNYLPFSTNTNNNSDSPNNRKQQPWPILQPYLSNLCVDKTICCQEVGKALWCVVECTSSDSWSYESVYLYVDLGNMPALNLYKSEGYVDVRIRWNPFWACSSSEIGFWVKKLQALWCIHMHIYTYTHFMYIQMYTPCMELICTCNWIS